MIAITLPTPRMHAALPALCSMRGRSRVSFVALFSLVDNQPFGGVYGLGFRMGLCDWVVESRLWRLMEVGDCSWNAIEVGMTDSALLATATRELCITFWNSYAVSQP